MAKMVRYEPNHEEFPLIMMSDGVGDAALAAGRDVVYAALGIAPESSATEKGQGDGTTYKEHFEVNRDVVTLDGSPRRSAVVINDADYAAQVEFGIGPGWGGERVQGGTPGAPQRVLGRAGAMVGEYKGGPPA